MLLKKNLLRMFLCATVFSFAGCEYGTDSEINIDFTTGTSSYEVVSNGIYVKISPTLVTVGEEVWIELSHEDNKVVDVTIESESLAYKKKVKLPSSVNMKMEVEGVHDISFSYKSLGTVSKFGTTITVYQ